jgi:hypothetical protein
MSRRRAGLSCLPCACPDIDVRELRFLMRDLGEIVNEAELVQIMTEFDTDGDGTISLPEFCALMVSYAQNQTKIRHTMSAPRERSTSDVVRPIWRARARTRTPDTPHSNGCWQQRVCHLVFCATARSSAGRACRPTGKSKLDRRCS